MKAKVDSALCIGCAQCASICPRVFEMSDEDVSTVIKDPVPTDVEGACRAAADNCPVEAITLEG